MAEKLRWGIVGTGGIAKTFAKALDQAQRGVKQAVASRTPERAAEFAAQHGFPVAHGSYAALIADPEVDAVYVATPHPCHIEPVLALLAAGKHVLCEKPLGVTAAECRQMVAAAEKAGVVLLEGFKQNVHPLIQRMVGIVKSGQLGTIRTIRSCFCYGLGNAYNVRGDLSLYGGGLYDVGCYCINFSRLVAGEEPNDVSAVWTIGETTGVDENLAVAMRFPAGTVALFDVGIRSAGSGYAEILGTEGSLYVPKPWAPDPKLAEMELRLKGKPTETIQIADGGNSFTLEADHLAAVVAGECEPLIPARDAVGNAVVMDRIWREMHG
ncbi:MAG: Gfo/Idh/MocA family oxidoreductase [Lentisphaeria bacterium]|jgi:predicted dehydrogenase|nr:Gfo/Idh/MocA family oxidoreductase [Lentisphaeria bacterium]